MLFEIGFQCLREAELSQEGCDLMLFEIGFQLVAQPPADNRGCDLMLFEIGFQWRDGADVQDGVVI